MYEGIDEQNSTECLEHHGILGMKWFKKNGPPYPLDSGDHSAGEKAAAKAAGVSVGSDSGKGSIENVKKKKSKPKKELTPEEKRAAALDAASKGDKKKIAKNMDQLTTDELRDAKNRAELRDALSKSDPDKKSKADKEKEEAIKSGDKATIQAYADKMTYNELAEAMNKMNLMAQLNHVDPPPTAMDKLKKAAEAAGKFKDAAEKGIGAYNQVAKIMNAVNKDANWPIIGEKPKEEKKDGDKDKENTKDAVKEVVKEVKKSYEEQAKEKFKNAKTDYKYDKKLEDWKAKQDARRAKGEDIEDDDDDDTPARSNPKPVSNDSKSEKEVKMEQHESNVNNGIHRFNTKTMDRLTQVTSQKGNELGPNVAFTNENYSRGPQTKSVNWNTGINAESMSNWKSTWNSVASVDNTRSISDDLTPAEQAFLDSFKKR